VGTHIQCMRIHSGYPYVCLVRWTRGLLVMNVGSHTPFTLSVDPWVTVAIQGSNGVSDRGGLQQVKGYILYSIISGTVYPFTGVKRRV
jgi:hypothetical protein